VSAYICTDVGVFTFTDMAGAGFARPAVMCISAFVSFLLGSGVAWLTRRRKGLLEAVLPAGWLPLLPISGLFCLGTWCTLNAVSRLSPVFVKVLFQLKLPVTVLLSMVLLKRTYTLLQVQALSNAFLAVTAFTVMRLGDVGNPFSSRGLTTAAVGLIHTGLAVLANVGATLLAERALRGGTPWYITVAHIKAGETLVALALLCLLPGSPLALLELLNSPSLMLGGFAAPVWGLAAFLVGDAWMSALVVKQLSSVVKALAKSLSMIVLYFIALLVLRRDAFSLPLLLLACLMANASLQFAHASTLRRRQDDGEQKAPAAVLPGEEDSRKRAGAPQEDAERPVPSGGQGAEAAAKPRGGAAGSRRVDRRETPPPGSEPVAAGRAEVSPFLREATTIPLAVMGSIAVAFFGVVRLQTVLEGKLAASLIPPP